jgi:hypothetical protein
LKKVLFLRLFLENPFAFLLSSANENVGNRCAGEVDAVGVVPNFAVVALDHQAAVEGFAAEARDAVVPTLSPLDDDSYNSVTCFCREPFNGRLMVECDNCKIWYHADCVHLTSATIPDVFICTRKKKCERIFKKKSQK